MLRIIDDNEIHITRGDRALINLVIPINKKVNYTFQPNDVITFAVYEKDMMSGYALIHKEFKIEEKTDTCVIELTSEDTKIGELIDEPVEYWYEIYYNGDQTVIGYDYYGEKIFMLYPEGSDNVAPDMPDIEEDEEGDETE